MIFSCILLAICSTLDSFGIGITYGLKNIKIPFRSKVILFICSFFITFISLFLGGFMFYIFPNNSTKYIGSLILVIIGIFLTLSCFKNKNNFDFDNSKNIDCKEALFLGFSLSLDSFGIGISSSLINNNFFILPILVSFFQLFFLSFGNFVGRKIKKASNISDNIWSFIAGNLLITIGIVKFFY